MPAVPHDKVPDSILLPESEPTPLVIVEGFLGSVGALVWGKFEAHLNLNCGSQGVKERRPIFPNIGPVGSLHDRACELYYALKGGTVDYGEEHSLRHDHLRYGRELTEGLYPQWSCQQPLHFFGHSMGGPTIIKMQWLIKEGFFGKDAHPDMLLSVTSVSAPFRGTQVVYTLGERVDAAPAVRPLSAGALLAKGIHIVTYFSPFLAGKMDLRLESRPLSCREMSVFSLLKQLWRSEWAESRDAAPYDVTFASVDEREAAGEGQVNQRTFYRSYAALMTKKCKPSENTHKPLVNLLSSPLTYILSHSIGSFDFSSILPKPSFLSSDSSHTDLDVERALLDSADISFDSDMGEEYWANDGIVPVFSQWHPLTCRDTHCRHLDRDPYVRQSKPEPGIWHVETTSDATHSSIVPFWLGTSRQRLFWEEFGCWLRAIDRQRI